MARALHTAGPPQGNINCPQKTVKKNTGRTLNMLWDGEWEDAEKASKAKQGTRRATHKGYPQGFFLFAKEMLSCLDLGRCTQ